MKSLQSVEAQRRRVLDELASIRSLRKGSLTEQWAPVVRQGEETKEVRGPYHLWTYKAGSKTVSERITGQEEVKHAQQDALNYQRFKHLCRELEELTHELGILERAESAPIETLKKTPRRQSRQTTK